MRTLIVAVALAVLCSCAPGGDARPCPRLVAAQPVAAQSGFTCTLYDKSAVGWTMKRAVFESDLAGGTPGDRQAFEASGQRSAASYDAFWTCTGYARGEKGAWCECPRGPSRWFEDLREKDSPVVWVTAQ